MGRGHKQFIGAQVTLHVYDLNPAANAWLYPLGLGAYHTGVEVHGTEWSFGGNKDLGESMQTGVFTCSPGTAGIDQGARYRCALPMGTTSFSFQAVDALISRMKPQFLARDYDLIHNNCNSFCNALLLELTGQALPSWINRLSSYAKCCPCFFPSSRGNSSLSSSRPADGFVAFKGSGYRLDTVSQSEPQTAKVLSAAERRELIAKATASRLSLEKKDN